MLRSAKPRHAAVLLPILAVLGIGLTVGVASAAAPVIENGGFETNDLSGWKVRDSAEGLWETYKGHPQFPKHGGVMPLKPFPKPPRGKYAAWSLQGNPATAILYQDFEVPQHATLKFITYYRSLDAIAAPHDLNGDTDNSETDPNQQYRVDLVKPSAPIRSLDKSDVLKNLFRTRTGDPEELRPKQIEASLKQFAGEKVRLRFAVADNLDELNAGVDAVKIKVKH